MPYRQVYIGDGEYIVARVSKEVVDEWLLLRERNRLIGYPDRPPDIDTPLLRSWIQHKGEPGYEEMLERHKVSEGVTRFPVYSVSVQSGPIEAKVLINWASDEGYSFRMLARYADGGSLTDHEAILGHDWSESDFEKALNFYHDLFLEDNPNPPMIATYFDFDEVEEEVNLAIKELEEYYAQQ